MNRTDFVCGIDGGGTKTTVLCSTLQNQIIEKRTFGPFNLNSIGEDAFRNILCEIVLFLQEIGNCRALCIGAAGVNNTRMAEIVTEVFSAAGIPCKLTGDQNIAHTGALGGKEGIALIAGTGSVCFGKTADGRTAMAGGWGHLLGDEGSGYALGRDALRATARLFDGYGEPTVLKNLMEAEFGLDSPEKMVTYVYSNDKSAVAAISHIVDEAASENDPVALGIIRDNASQLVSQVCAVSKRLGLKACDVALLGGLLANPTHLRGQFVRLLHEANPLLKCTEPLHSAAEGAVIEALSLVQNS